EADRRIDARIERHDHARHTEVARHAAGVHRAGTAKCEQHELAQIMATHGRDGLDRLFHLYVDDAHDAFGCLLDAHAERLGDLALDRTPGFLGVEPHAAAEEVLGRKMSHHKVAVGDGRHLAAAAVAGWPGHGASRIGPDLQYSETINTRDRASTGADRVDVHHRHREVAALDLAAAGDRGVAVLDQRHVTGGSAHVEGDDVLKADHPARVGACGHAARGT